MNRFFLKEIFEDENNKYIKSDAVLGIGFFVLSFFIYFAKIREDLPNPDAVWNGVFYKVGYGWEMSLGRYMIALLQVWRGYVVNTSFTTLLCIGFLSLICLHVIKIFGIKSLGCKLAAGAVIIISPAVGSTLTYYYCSDLYMLSYFMTVLSVCFMVGKQGKRGVVLSGVLLMISASIYQAYVSLAILLCWIYLMRLLLDVDTSSKEVCKKAINCIQGGGIGVGLYLVTNKCIQAACGIAAAEGRGFSRMGMFRFKDMNRQILQCYEIFRQYYFSETMINNDCYGRKYINLFFFIVLGIIILRLVIMQKVDMKRKIVFGAAVVLFPLITVNICILAPEVSVYDTTGILMLPTMNYTYVLAVVMIQLLYGQKRGGKYICMGIIGCIAVFLMLLNLELGAQSYMRHNMLKTYNVARQIEERVAQYTGNGKICIIGNMEDGNYPELYADLAESQHWVTAGYKMIWADFNGCQRCWALFMNQYLGREYDTCSYDEYRDISSTSEYASMGMFPNADGIAKINDIIVVKLSDALW